MCSSPSSCSSSCSSLSSPFAFRRSPLAFAVVRAFRLSPLPISVQCSLFFQLLYFIQCTALVLPQLSTTSVPPCQPRYLAPVVRYIPSPADRSTPLQYHIPLCCLHRSRREWYLSPSRSPTSPQPHQPVPSGRPAPAPRSALHAARPCATPCRVGRVLAERLPDPRTPPGAR